MENQPQTLLKMFIKNIKMLCYINLEMEILKKFL